MRAPIERQFEPMTVGMGLDRAFRLYFPLMSEIAVSQCAPAYRDGVAITDGVGRKPSFHIGRQLSRWVC